MWNLITKFDELLGFISVIGAFLCGVLGILFAAYYQMQETARAQIAANLKQDMLNRGMSVEEIQDVLDAGTHAAAKALAKRAYSA